MFQPLAASTGAAFRERVQLMRGHRRPQFMFRIRTPIRAIELQKHRRIRKRHVGLDDQHAKSPADLIELCNDLLVKHRIPRPFLQQTPQLFPVR